MHSSTSRRTPMDTVMQALSALLPEALRGNLTTGASTGGGSLTAGSWTYVGWN